MTSLVLKLKKQGRKRHVSLEQKQKQWNIKNKIMKKATLIFKASLLSLTSMFLFSIAWAQSGDATSTDNQKNEPTQQISAEEAAQPQQISAEEAAQPQQISAEEAAQQADEKKRTLEELLAVPFNQLQNEEADQLSSSLNDSDNITIAKSSGEVKLPSPPAQSKAERDMENQLDSIMRKLMPNVFVGVTVSIRYLMETLPVTKQKKQLSKLKLPGFDNNVWVPTLNKQVVGIINQVRVYTTIFAVVNKPISLFNVEVLRQKLSEQVDRLNLDGRDVLKVVHVTNTAPATHAVDTMRNAAAEQSVKKNKAIKKQNVNEVSVAEEPGMVLENQDANSAEIAPESELMQQSNIPQVSILEPEAIFEPEPQPTRVDMKTRVETTRYLLQSRDAYMENNYDEAITAIRKAIELNPASSQAYEMLGSIYYRLGWNGMAVENWERALNLDPTNEGLKKYLMRLSRQG